MVSYRTHVVNFFRHKLANSWRQTCIILSMEITHGFLVHKHSPYAEKAVPTWCRLPERTNQLSGKFLYYEKDMYARYSCILPRFETKM